MHGLDKLPFTFNIIISHCAAKWIRLTINVHVSLETAMSHAPSQETNRVPADLVAWTRIPGALVGIVATRATLPIASVA